MDTSIIYKMKNKFIFLFLLITNIIFGQSTTPNISKVLSVSSASQITAAQATLGIGSSTVYATSPLSASSGTVSLTGIVPVANGGTNNTINASNYSIITKDSTTDGVMYPLIGNATSGNLLVKNSGLNLNYIPKNSQIGLGINPKSYFRQEDNELYALCSKTTKDTNFIISVHCAGTGTRSFASFRAINNLNYLADWGMVGSGAASVGIQHSGMAGLYTNNPTGLAIGADGTGYIAFGTGTSIPQKMILGNNGFLGVGVDAGTVPGTLLTLARNSNDALTSVAATNTSTGGSAQTMIRAYNSSKGVNMVMYGTGYSTSGLVAAGSALIWTDNTTHLGVGTTAAAPLIFFTGGAASANERARINANGGFILVGGNIYMKDSVTPFNYWKGVMTSGVLIWTDTGSTTIPSTL